MKFRKPIMIATGALSAIAIYFLAYESPQIIASEQSKPTIDKRPHFSGNDSPGAALPPDETSIELLQRHFLSEPKAVADQDNPTSIHPTVVIPPPPPPQQHELNNRSSIPDYEMGSPEKPQPYDDSTAGSVSARQDIQPPPEEID